MKAINCPQCGAPAKVEETTQAVYTCPYCNRSFETGNIPAVEEEEEDAPVPQIVVIQRPAPTRTSSGGGSSMILGLVITVFVMGIVGFTTLRSTGGNISIPGIATWDGTSALECGGNDQLTITDVTATLPGTAIIVGGNCHVRFVNCHLKADTVFEVGGNGEVRLEGGTFEGETAIDAGGNAVVRIAGATVTGKRKHRGNARIDGK